MPNFVAGGGSWSDNLRQALADEIAAGQGPVASALKGSFVSSIVAAGTGIDPTGVSDSTAALQAKLTEAGDSRRPLFIPRGRYKITSTLSYTFTDSTKWVGGFRIFGEGMGTARDGSVYSTAIEPTNAVTGPAIRITGTANANNSNSGQVNGLVIKDLAIRGVEGGSNGDGIELKFWTNASIENVAFIACTNGLRLLRQANDTSFGYGNGTRVANCHFVLNRSYGVDMADVGAILAVFTSCNFGANTGGGIRMAPGPAVIEGNTIFTGNAGPALRIVKPTGVSNATGPTVIGAHFEANGSVPAGDYSTDSAQIIIDYAQGPAFYGCTFLGSTNGEHSIKAGFTTDSVTGLTMVANRHFGKVSVTGQRAYVLGSTCLRSLILDTEITGMGGSSARATSSQSYGSTAGIGTAALAAGARMSGAQTISNSTATPIIANADLPLGARGLFEIASQGGSIFAMGYVTRGRDGTPTAVTQMLSSANCSLSLVSNTVRVTQTSGAAVAMYWSYSIQDTP